MITTDKFLLWLDAPRMVGLLFAIITFGYILYITIKHHDEFWEGIKGEDGKLQAIEGVLVIWLALFVPLVIADFAFGLVASDKVWWTMDSVFFICVGGKTMTVMNRQNNLKKKDDTV